MTTMMGDAGAFTSLGPSHSQCLQLLCRALALKMKSSTNIIAYLERFVIYDCISQGKIYAVT